MAYATKLQLNNLLPILMKAPALQLLKSNNINKNIVAILLKPSEGKEHIPISWKILLLSDHKMSATDMKECK